MLQILIPVLVLLLADVKEAKAYADPGTGAMIWQLLSAAFVGAMFYCRRFLTSIKRRRKPDQGNE